MLKYLCCAMLFTLSAVIVEAQECGTQVTEEQRAFMESIFKNAKPSNYRTNQAIVDIPLKAHIIRQTNGEGGLSEAQLNSAMNVLNSFYNSADIRFYLFEGINFIDDDEYYEFDAADEGKLAGTHDVNNVINVYFFNSITSQGSALCGYTRFPPSEDRVFMANGCTTSGNTFAHELGHYFTLFHTHGKTNTGTTDELVNGSNCTTAGDNICDTPADPNLSGKVNGSCQYTGNLKDANGDFYNPSVANIMSYAPGSCRNNLTTGQYERIRLGFEQGRSYLNFTSSDFTALFESNKKEICVGEKVEYESIAFGAVQYDWTFEGGTPATSTSANPKVTYTSGGAFNVSLVATNSSGETAEISINNYMDVEDPIANATLENQIYQNDASALNNDIEIFNPDAGITFGVYEGVDFEGNPTSNAIWVNNFEYFTEAPRNIDGMNLRPYQIEGIKSIDISFNYAYTYRLGFSDIVPNVYDTLVVGLRSSCNSNENILWVKGGDELKTTEPLEVAYFPALSDWSEVKVTYNRKTSDEFLNLFIRNISYNGNNLFIDNIEVIPDYSVDAPVLLEVKPSDGESLVLNWDDNSINEMGFIIERSSNGEGFITLDSVEANNETYVDDNFPSGELTYRIKAYGVINNISQSSNEITVDSSIVTSISDDIEKSKFIIWPNPMTDRIKLSKSIKETFDTIRFIDSTGNTVLKQNVNSSSIDVSKLRSGLYLVMLEGRNSSEVKRVLKIR